MLHKLLPPLSTASQSYNLRQRKHKYKLLCPRGTQTCALAVANINVNGNGKVILDTHPESDQRQNWTFSSGSPPAPTHQIWLWSMNHWTRSWDILRTKTVRTDRHTPMITRPCGLRRAGNYLLPLRTGRLSDHNFIQRMLYLDAY